MHTPKVNGVFCTPLLKVQIPFVVTSLRSETEHGTIAPRTYDIESSIASDGILSTISKLIVAALEQLKTEMSKLTLFSI